MEAVLAELETALGHSFARPELLVRALTHRSLAHELAANALAANGQAAGEHAADEQIQAGGNEEATATGDNERLEFLGDAVLGLVVGEALFIAHPDWQEGELTRVRAQLEMCIRDRPTRPAVIVALPIALSRSSCRIVTPAFREPQTAHEWKFGPPSRPNLAASASESK